MNTDTQALLMQTLAPSAANGGGNSFMRDWMTQMAESHPQLKLLLQVMQQRQQEQHDDEAAENRAAETLARRREVLQQLRAVTARIKNECDDLRSRQARLAAALGACQRCWGEDDGCRFCRGAGRPGFAQPERKLFERLVQPAWKKLHEDHVAKEN